MCVNDYIDPLNHTLSTGPAPNLPPGPKNIGIACVSPTYEELRTLLLDCIRACLAHQRLGQPEALIHRLNVMEGLLSRK
jgi:hypothetical protein